MNWDAPREYVWNLSLAEWIIDDEEHQGADWRHVDNANVRYKLDIYRNEWVIINATTDYEENWRNKLQVY